MKMDIRGKNMAVTEALKQYAENKIGRIAKYVNDESSGVVHVLMSVQKESHGVEVTFHHCDFTLRAEEKGEDMYAAIDRVEDKLLQQLRRYKTKLARKKRVAAAVPAYSASEDERPEDEENMLPVRTKRFSLKPMDEEEAILQMVLLDHSFYVFRNASNEQVEVVYKRKDGKFGHITQ